MKTIQILDEHFKPYISHHEIKHIVKHLGKCIAKDYKYKELVIYSVLNGSFVFASDLLRSMNDAGIDRPIQFIRYNSYSGTSSSGIVHKTLNFPENIKGHNVLIVEDIIDSGLSMQTALEDLKKLEPKSVEICTLLFKPDNFKGSYDIRYIGKEIPNDFIVGYGMDYDEYGRGLKDIYVHCD